jgi:peptide deformylase
MPWWMTRCATVDDLLETMYAARGWDHKPVGEKFRVAVVDVSKGKAAGAINGAREQSVETDIAEEGCLSIPEVFGDVERPLRVVIDALDRHGAPFRHESVGYQARAIQHEIDHLDGVLFLDHLSAVKRSLLLSKWKRLRKGETGYVKEVTPEPAGEL